MSNKENLVNIFEELHEQIIIALLHASNVNYGQIHASIAEPFPYDPGLLIIQGSRRITHLHACIVLYLLTEDFADHGL